MEFLGFFLAVLVFVAMISVYVLYLTRPIKKGASKAAADLSVVVPKWSEVQAMMKQGGPANYRQAIMEGDKLVDLVLRTKVSGETMGERLKNSRRLFSQSTYNELWTAHKIRNKVAHEADFEGLSSDAILAVRGFERALKELKVI